MDKIKDQTKIRPWKTIQSTEVFSNGFLSVEESECERSGDKKKGLFYKIQFPQWVNVIPVTKEGDIVFIRQFRHGVQKITLEIPGGIVESHETPLAGAKRELAEETGYCSDNFVSLGVVHPNPAIQGNVCNIYLALNASLSQEVNFDENEEIVIQKVKMNKLLEVLNSGQITNAMVLSSFTLAITNNLLPGFTLDL
jgi:ADP-ribose diphosphatase